VEDVKKLFFIMHTYLFTPISSSLQCRFFPVLLPSLCLSAYVQLVTSLKIFTIVVVVVTLMPIGKVWIYRLCLFFLYGYGLLR